MPSIAIIGGGISGLSSAWYLAKLLPDCQITLYESESRLGGKIKSEKQEGFLFEHGPNGFMNSRQDIMNLCNDLGLEARIIKSNDASAERFILKDKILRRLPKKPQQIFTSSFLPLKAKFRLLLEPFIKKMDKEDETLYQFAQRRLGQYMADYIIDPFTSGVFGADCRKISVRSAFPALRDMEQQHGSLFKALKAKMKNSGQKKQGKLSSFKNGMEELTLALREKLADRVQFITSSSVSKISSQENGTTLSFIKDNQLTEACYDIIITACPAEPTANILAEELGPVSDKIKQIPYSAMAVVPQGFKQQKPANINAFGYLIPSLEPSKVLGVLFSSCIFNGRSNPNSFSLRAMLGGGKDPDITKKTDEEILELILAENKQTLGIDKIANFHKIIRWQKAIPRYDLGHWKIILELEDALKNKAIFITGNAFYGVSMSDCITASMKVAQKVKDFLEKK
jgi:protoporphyrinogen/coproporphyrinogen III oxidase